MDLQGPDFSDSRNPIFNSIGSLKRLKKPSDNIQK